MENLSEGIQINSLEDLHTYYNVPKEIIRFDIPDGFALEETSIYETPGVTNILLRFQAQDRSFCVCYIRHTENPGIRYEANAGWIETFEVGDMLCFVLRNNDRNQIVWQYGNYACAIYGDITLSEIYQVIESMKEQAQ